MQGQTPTRCIKTLVAGLHAIKLILYIILEFEKLAKILFEFFSFNPLSLTHPVSRIASKPYPEF